MWWCMDCDYKLLYDLLNEVKHLDQVQQPEITGRKKE